MTAAGRPPEGWSVQQETRKFGGVEQTRTHFVTRTGKKVSTMYEVHQHLKVCGLARGVSCGCWGV